MKILKKSDIPTFKSNFDIKTTSIGYIYSSYSNRIGFTKFQFNLTVKLKIMFVFKRD